MVGGKTFLISFAIGATMGGNFQKTMLSTSTQLMKVKNETKILQNNARSLQQAFRSSQAEVLRYQSAITLLNAKLTKVPCTGFPYWSFPIQTSLF